MSQRLAVAIVLLVLLSIAVQAIFLASPASAGLPLDDGWIHATYARNLARHGQLCLNPGEPTTGTTSFLWTALLAAARLAGLGPVAAPLAWSIPLHAWLVVLCLLLLRGAGLGDWWAAAGAASCALLGSLVWISLSGMESTLFLALGLSAVWCRSRGRLVAAGLLAGLLVLTRPEGMALPLAMGLAELPRLWRRDWSRWRVWLRLFAPAAVAAVVYLAINLAVAGQPLTATFAGRRWLAGQPAEVSLSPIAVAARAWALARAWIVYLHRWVFGSVAMEWLRLPHARLAGAASSIVALLVAFGGMGAGLADARRKGHERSPIPLLLRWALVHNAAYAVLLPVHGHAGRYQAVNFVVLALCAVLGAVRLLRERFGARRFGPALLAAWLVLCGASAALWRTIYRDSVDHIATTHIACGRWIADHLPPDAVVATYDLGAVAYFAERRIVDLGGLVDPEMARHLFAGDAAPYMRRQGTTHLAMVGHFVKGRSSLFERLGISKPGPDRPRTRLLKPWSVPYDRYPLHHAATSNAMPRMSLYDLQWPD